MTKLQRAKQQTRKKWQRVLRDLPKLSIDDFGFGFGGCAFCAEYSSGAKISDRNCSGCPIKKQCAKYRGKKRTVLGKRYWRKPAAALCRWVLRENDKVREG